MSKRGVGKSSCQNLSSITEVTEGTVRDLKKKKFEIVVTRDRGLSVVGRGDGVYSIRIVTLPPTRFP